jgi:hypothetical protein
VASPNTRNGGAPMTDTVVIGFGYRMRSGKDTAITEIIAKRGPKTYCNGAEDGHYDIRSYGFADALKREVTAAALSAGGMENLFRTELFMQSNGNFIALPQWVRDGYEANPDMTDPLCPLGKQRTLLQWWGTEYRRSVDPNYWVNKLADTIAKEHPQFALIRDLRFQNEFQYINARGYTVRVDRDGLPQSEHASEHQLDEETDWDYTLDNNGTLEDFKAGALVMFDDIQGVGHCEFPYGYNGVS